MHKHDDVLISQQRNGVLVNQVMPNDKDKNLNEVRNYYFAALKGYDTLKKREFSNEFFFDIHNELMQGNVRKAALIGEYRKGQNFIGKGDKTHAIVFVSPAPENVSGLMDNLIDYINRPNDQYRPLVRTAIIHAQFETIGVRTESTEWKSCNLTATLCRAERR